ncbi:MAG: hypothetical protein LBM66_05300, partial [Bifidobacteriaceae bacterium]|jgi:hypothetical protein|nr:hypothetical protein [Bifidobacteriaceae bacterium]
VRWNSSCPPVGGVYPTKPLTNDIKVGVRIDGIYTLNVQGSFSFAVQAVLNGSGAFQTGYQPASDHLLVKASLPM